jgi:hypothetical protein
MYFNYNNWYWSELTEQELIAITKDNRLSSEQLRAQQELDRRTQEQTKFLEL